MRRRGFKPSVIECQHANTREERGRSETPIFRDRKEKELKDAQSYRKSKKRRILLQACRGVEQENTIMLRSELHNSDPRALEGRPMCQKEGAGKKKEVSSV